MEQDKHRELLERQSEVILAKSTKNHKKIIFKDILYKSVTYLFSSFTILAVVAILVFVFSKGWKNLSWELITSDNKIQTALFKCSYINDNSTVYSDPKTGDDYYFSTRWGVAFKDSTDLNKDATVEIHYIDSNSPLLSNVVDVDSESFILKQGNTISELIVYTDEQLNDLNEPVAMPVTLGSKSNSKPTDMTLAKWYATTFDKTKKIVRGQVSYGGNGIRGSLLTTLLMIGLTLLFALPLGIIAAIYLAYYSKNGKLSTIVKNAIDLLSGIPSIIYGLLGAIVFIPFCSGGGNLGSILSGALTLAIMVLPVIVKNTLEAIKGVPNSLRQGSLALGASESQTLFKVVLPNSMSGILTGTILAVGRIIGESASLIYAVGTAIKDKISIFEPSATLSVHIWNVMHGENPNYDVACAISIIILFIILILNLILSLISLKLNKFSKRDNDSIILKIISIVKKQRAKMKEKKEKETKEEVSC